VLLVQQKCVRSLSVLAAIRSHMLSAIRMQASCSYFVGRAMSEMFIHNKDFLEYLEVDNVMSFYLSILNAVRCPYVRNGGRRQLSRQ